MEYFGLINKYNFEINEIIYWGLGIGDGGLGIGDWAHPPIPNPQSPIPNPHFSALNFFYFNFYYF